MTDTHKTIQYNLRITEELRERLKKSAEIHNRSMNADIVARIEQSFFPVSRLSQKELEEISQLAGETYIKAMVKFTKNLPKEQAEKEMLRLIYEVANM